MYVARHVIDTTESWAKSKSKAGGQLWYGRAYRRAALRGCGHVAALLLFPSVNRTIDPQFLNRKYYGLRREVVCTPMRLLLLFGINWEFYCVLRTSGIVLNSLPALSLNLALRLYLKQGRFSAVLARSMLTYVVVIL